MRVLFVYTISNSLPSPKKPLADWFEISLALSYLASNLEQAGHETSLVVLRHQGYRRELRSALERAKPDMVAFTAVATEYPFVVKVATEVRRLVPAAYQIIGGAHPSLRPAEVIEGPFDAVCVSEGEEPIVELAAALSRGEAPRGIANLWIKNDEGVEQNAARDFSAAIDALPLPKRDFWQPYLEHEEKHVILLGRGCPFLCTYCANHALRNLAKGKYVRMRSHDSVLGELAALVEQFPWANYVYFEVETISADQEWALGFARRLEEFNAEREQPLEFAINLRVHANVRFEGLFAALKRANFRYVRIGIESGSPRVRREVLARPESNEDIVRAFDDARQAGLKTYAYNLVGLPGETPEDFMQTVELNRRCGADRSYIGIFYPYPGTGLERVCRERGIRVPPLTDSAERYRARLNLPEFSNRKVEHCFRSFSYLVQGDEAPWLAHVDSYLWRSLRGYPWAARLVNRVTGTGLLARMGRVMQSFQQMFPRDA